MQTPPSYQSNEDEPGPSRKTTQTPATSSTFTMPGVSRPASPGVTVEDPFTEKSPDGARSSAAQSIIQAYLQRAPTEERRNEEPENPEFHHRLPSVAVSNHRLSQATLYPYGTTNSSDTVTYIDENYRVQPGSLKDTGTFGYGATPNRSREDLEYADPYIQENTSRKKSRLAGFFGAHDEAKFPLDQQIEAKRRGALFRQSRPYVCWALTLVMAGILIYELIFNQNAQGTPFSMKPYVNPLLGPSQAAMIEIGARFVPCMRLVEEAPPTLKLGCPANTNNPPTIQCTVEQLCAHGGFANSNPNQWWRFITPIFLHAGIIHLLVNMFVQCTVAAQVEREVGSLSFIIIYFAAGIFGNVLGGNFALVGLPSLGASGAIFGTVGALWVDLIAHWRFEHKPTTKLMMLTFELIFGIALGFLPGTDNFAHIGGFCLGLLSSIALYPVLSETKRHRSFVWFFRGLAVIIGIILYFVLIRNFYTSDPYRACSWCRYLSCIPSAMNDHCQGTGITATD